MPDQGAVGSWADDPILAQFRALKIQNESAAEAGAQAARTQALIRFGYSPELAGLYGDEATAGAARANPFSILANLAHQHEARARGLDENLNKRNLFYSGYRGTQIGEEGRQYLGEQAGAQGGLQELLGGIGESLLRRKSELQQGLVGNEQDAYQRWLENALKYGTGGGGGGKTFGQGINERTWRPPGEAVPAVGAGPSRTATLLAGRRPRRRSMPGHGRVE